MALPPGAMHDDFMRPVPLQHCSVYNDPDSRDLDGIEVQGTITEAMLRDGMEADGAAITDALAVIRDRPHYPRQFLLFLQCSWKGNGYSAVALHRGKGLREHKTMEPWFSFLDSLRYRGPVTVIRDDDERIKRLGLVGLE